MDTQAAAAPECAQIVLEAPEPKKRYIPKGPPLRPRLEAPWQAIRDCVASGVSMGKVAKRFAEYHPNGSEGMYELIRKRASRESWYVPVTAMAKARERLEEAGFADVHVPSESQSRVTPPSDPVEVGTIVTENAQELAENGSLIGLKLVHGLLKRASLKSESLAPLVDVKDISQAIRAVRMAGSLDKPQAPVQFNLWGQGVSQVREVGTSSVSTPSRELSEGGVVEWSDLDVEE